MRRGACPGLSEPMQTGDGLLVRLRPGGTIPLPAFAGLCTAARAHGSGIVEVTARGSIQVRGLSEDSAQRFAADIAALGIAADDGLPILTDPLAGIGAHGVIDATALAAELRQKLAGRAAARFAPKISVAIDGGGTPGLDAIAADVRLCAAGRQPDQGVQVSIGGNGASAAVLGRIATADGAEAAMRLLDVLAQHGPEARARDLAGTGAFDRAIADLLLNSARLRESGNQAPDSRLRGNERQAETLRSSDAIGLHDLRDGSLARGIGLAFGHAEASSLERLAETAAATGACGLRTALGRALMAIGMAHDAAAAFAAAAERLGFVVDPRDARLRVIACPGAPCCASGLISARAIAPSIATTVGELAGHSLTIHISGCRKGCAHPAPASLTIVGTDSGCALVADGTTRHAPFAVVAPDDLPAAITRYARKRKCKANHG